MLQFLTDVETRVYVHSPTMVNPLPFARDSEFLPLDQEPSPEMVAASRAQRDIDVLVVGAQLCDPPIYPLRPRITKLIREGKISAWEVVVCCVLCGAVSWGPPSWPSSYHPRVRRMVHSHPGYIFGKSAEEAQANGYNASVLEAQVRGVVTQVGTPTRMWPPARSGGSCGPEQMPHWARRSHNSPPHLPRPCARAG